MMLFILPQVLFSCITFLMAFATYSLTQSITVTIVVAAGGLVVQSVPLFIKVEVKA